MIALPRSFIMLLAALLVLPMALATRAQPAGAGKKFKTVTRDFLSQEPIAIPGVGGATAGPADPYPSTIHVQGFRRAKITDVNVTLRNFGHLTPDDVDVLLVGPHGQRSLLMSDVGGSHEASNLSLTLDDEAVKFMPDSVQLATGSFKPTNAVGNDPGDPFPPGAPLLTETAALSVFDGSKPNGPWQLFSRDDSSGWTGIVKSGWELEITAKVKKKKKTRK
jgi:subtilisin-like proprotein convertase family protein